MACARSQRTTLLALPSSSNNVIPMKMGISERQFQDVAHLIIRVFDDAAIRTAIGAIGQAQIELKLSSAAHGDLISDQVAIIHVQADILCETGADRPGQGRRFGTARSISKEHGSTRLPHMNLSIERPKGRRGESRAKKRAAELEPGIGVEVVRVTEQGRRSADQSGTWLAQPKTEPGCAWQRHIGRRR